MKIVLNTSIRPSCYCYTTRTVCVMKIVLDTSIRPSCYCYTTRTACVMKTVLDTSIIVCFVLFLWRGPDRMVVGFTITYITSAYHH